jgi:RNA polymerase sigma-70 factor (ECF subfamily)
MGSEYRETDSIVGVEKESVDCIQSLGRPPTGCFDKNTDLARRISVEAVTQDLPHPLSEYDRHSSGTGGEWRTIFDALAAGRVSALDALYNLAAQQVYGLAVWRTGSREDAADVVQDVFVRVAEQGAKLAKIRNPKSWLLTVTHRAALDVIRRRRRRPSDSLEEHPLLVAVDDDSERALDATRASALLAGMPSKHRDVVYLKHFADCTFAEIGAIVGVPKFTAASRYRAGIAKLRRLLEGETND